MTLPREGRGKRFVLFANIAVLVLSMLTTLWYFKPAAAADFPSPALPCDGSIYQVRQDLVPESHLYKISLTPAGGYTETEIGPLSQSIRLNALGYNPTDGFLYGFQRSTNHVWRINDTGQLTDMGAVTGVPVGFSLDGGTFDRTGIMHAVIGDTGVGTSIMYHVNLSTMTATSVTLSEQVTQGDLAIDPTSDIAYMMPAAGGNPFRSVNLTTGVVTQISTNTSKTGGSFAFDAAGNPYAFGTNNGAVYIVNKTTGVYTQIASGGAAANGSDGASCAFSNRKIDTIKSLVSVNAISGTTFDVTYDLGVKNTSPTDNAPNVQITEDARRTFVSGSPTISVTAPPSMQAGSCAVNTSFNATTNTGIFGGNDDLNIGDSCVARVTLRLVYASAGIVPSVPQNNTTYASSVFGAGPNPGYTFTNGVPVPPNGMVASDDSTNTNTFPGTPNGDTPTPTPVTLQAEADLAISKRATNPMNGSTVTTAVAGTNVNYVLDVTNNGPSTASGVSVSDTLPAGITPSTATGTGWTCNVVTQTVTCTRSSATTGAAPSITVQATISANATGGLQNNATVTSSTTDPVPANNQDEVTLTVTREADLSIVKSHAGTPVAGGTYTYNYDVTNNGPSDTPSFTTSDTLNASLTFVSAGSSVSCSAVGQVVTCNGGSLAVGDSESFTIVVSVDPGFPGGAIANTATVAPPVGVTDPQPANNSSNDLTSVSVDGDLAITKTHSATFVAGQNGQYQMQITNNGPSNAQGIVVSDNLPAGTMFVSGTGTNWTCSNVGSAVSCQLSGSLTSGATSNLTLTVAVTSSYIGSLVNTATVTATTDDSNPANNTDTDPQTVNTSADLSVNKTLTTGPLVAGDNETYRLAITNNGPSDARVITVSDQLPAGLTYVGSIGTGWSCSANSSQLITCTSPYMVTGQTSNIDVIVHIPSDATGSVTNPVTVASTTTDPTPGNNTDSTTDSVTQDTDLAITQSHPSKTYKPGDSVDFTLNVVNNGPSDADNVVITDTLPVGLEYVSIDPGTSGFSCSQVGQVVTCTRSSFPVGTSVQLVLGARISSNFTGSSLQNVATVSTSTTDTVSANNTSDDSLVLAANSTNGSGGSLSNTGTPILPVLSTGIMLIAASFLAIFARRRSVLQ